VSSFNHALIVLIDGNINSPVKLRISWHRAVHKTLPSRPDPHTSSDDANLNLYADAESFEGPVIFSLAG
jgi:hypothetical protein